MRRIDPITLTVVWNSLVSIADEMGVALRRTAFSEAVREGDDFSTGLFDRTARLVAQGNFSPGHLGAMPYVVRNALEYVPPETLRPGDMIATNDSFLAGGHFPDMFLIAPAFEDDSIVGYAVNIAHHVDVGGLAPGSQAIAGVVHAVQEGFRMLPVRLVREGEFDAELMRLFLGNVRLPDKVRGDLMAQRNANHVGIARLRKLFGTHGQAALEEMYEEILDRSEARARELIAKLPSGTYSFEDFLDDYGPATEPIRIAVDVTLTPEGTATIDYSRSSDQVPAGINSYLNYTRAYTSFPIRIFAGIDVPNNAGVERVIKAVAREGCFFNPQYPAPSGGRSIIQVRMFEAVNGAMAQAVPQRAMAAFSHWGNPNIAGTDPLTGTPWIMYDMLLAGYGGCSWKDGVEGMAPVMNCANIPVEVHEAANPVRVRCLELIQDTGGAGKFRGGCGLRKDYEVLRGDAWLSTLGERHLRHPYGLFGGEPGALARTLLIRDGKEIDLPSKANTALRCGDIISFRLSGAGGYGDPLERDRSQVVTDVQDGYVSRAAAIRSYGLSSDDLPELS